MRALELFCCSGGMARGFLDAGIEFAFAFDSDPNACASYEANIGHRPIRMDVRDLLRMVEGGWSPGQLDLIVADPPCTPWSRAGKRKGLADERDMLAETVDLIDALRPRAYLIGNVPGLQDGDHLTALRRTIGRLAKRGYCVGDFSQLDAAAFGVPQRRVRPFWFGHRIGTPCISWPVPTHGDPKGAASLPGIEPLRPWVTCREALEHLPPADLGRPVRLKPNTRHEPSKGDAPGKVVGAKSRGNGGQAIALDHPRHPPSEADAPARTVTAGGTGGSKRAMRVPQGQRIGDPAAPGATVTAKASRIGAGEAHVLAWPWDRPSTTVCAGIDKIAPAGEHAGQFGPNAIVLSERAAAILQGFPPGWRFEGKTKAARWGQIGMAMPPALALAVARAVRRALTLAMEAA